MGLSSAIPPLPSGSRPRALASSSLGGWRTWSAASPVVVALALSTLTAVGCGPQSHANTPRDALVAYADAVEQKRYEDAYAALSTETRASLDLPTYVALLKDHPQEVEGLLSALRRADNAADLRATIRGKDGEQLDLVYEDGGWRVEASALQFFPQDEPLKALSSFVEAYDKNRYDVLLRFVPTSHLEGMDAEVLQTAWEGEQKAEMDAVVEGVRAALSDPNLELVGTRATLAYEGGGTVELVRERGVWKIEDFK